jgi:hypothetical protein
MITIIMAVLFVVLAIAIKLLRVPTELSIVKKVAVPVFGTLGILIGVLGAFSYNDAGYCQHVRTIFGSESATCETGWYFSGWGSSTAWPYFITVAHTLEVDAEGSAVNTPYNVRMSDNWTGDVFQTTRFGIPQDSDQFLKMARDFRSPERLITTTLRPSVTTAIDTVANMFTMEQYFSGQMRDQFKIEFKDTLMKGQPKVQLVPKVIDAMNAESAGAAASDTAAAADTSDVGDNTVTIMVAEKVLDDNGKEIRTVPEYLQYGIVVSQAILEKIEADPAFEEQQKKRKDAVSRRVIAKEQRLEQEEQRLLRIAEGDTEIAKRQAEAKTEQIQLTTEAETQKKLAITAAERVREEARVAKETAAINLERARIDAEAVQVAADAAAYEKRVILEADGALAQKLAAWTEAQKVWADAAAKINVPSTVIAGGNGSGNSGSALGTVESFMNMLMVKTAKDLAVDTNITPTK